MGPGIHNGATTMKKFLLGLLLTLPMAAMAAGYYYECDGGMCERVGVDELPRPDFNPNIGAVEAGTGGRLYFDDNAASASHQIKVGPGRLLRVIASGSTTAVVTFFDDSDGTCSSGQMLPAFTVGSATVWNPNAEIGMDFNNGLCMLVATAADAEISLVYLP